MKPTPPLPLSPPGTPANRTMKKTARTIRLTTRHGPTSIERLHLPTVLNLSLERPVCLDALSGPSPVRTKPTVIHTFSSEFTGPNDRVRPSWCAVALLAFTDRTQGPSDALRKESL